MNCVVSQEGEVGERYITEHHLGFVQKAETDCTFDDNNLVPEQVA